VKKSFELGPFVLVELFQCPLLVTSREANSLDDVFVIHTSIISRPAQHDLIINLAFMHS
jgi:hypothetical protein